MTLNHLQLSAATLVVLVMSIVGIVVALLVRRRAVRVRARRVKVLHDRFERLVIEFVSTPGAHPSPKLTSARRLDERAAIAGQLARISTLLQGEARVRIIERSWPRAQSAPARPERRPSEWHLRPRASAC